MEARFLDPSDPPTHAHQPNAELVELWKMGHVSPSFVEGAMKPPPDRSWLEMEPVNHRPGNRFCVCSMCRNQKARLLDEDLLSPTLDWPRYPTEGAGRHLPPGESVWSTPVPLRGRRIGGPKTHPLPFADGAEPAVEGSDVEAHHVWWCPDYDEPESHSERFQRLLKVRITPSTGTASCSHPSHREEKP